MWKKLSQYRIHTTVDCNPQLIFSGILNEAEKVPHGKAHDNARQIVEDYDALTLLNNKLKDLTEPKDISLLLCCLSSLSVRNEYCKKVADDGGLNIILKVLVDPDQDKNVIKESLKLVETLAENDDVKRDIGKTEGIPFIVNSISKKKNKSICQVGCDSLTALSLRSPENAKQIVDCGGDGVIIEIMKAHKSIAEIVHSKSPSRRIHQSFICPSSLKTISSVTENLDVHESINAGPLFWLSAGEEWGFLIHLFVEK
ncbi:unnamed protein product [Lepeophtheirus salmonis]|uniref:(salmon louse) hypothetical protein n=1 Tax=Lepeophtheirus salmonis TaxID=72036 RepID=A0A7R8H149_LEPSM|nr:unnamed protein product [Lepeophtheirus salmonis]CAF2802441.1 unnamed protein product [Lepeophtheirus salmonis]